MTAKLRFLIISLFVFTLVIRPGVSRAEPLPTVRAAFDKTFYSRSDVFTLTGTITNSSPETLRYTRLTLTIFAATKPGAPLLRAFDSQAPPVIKQTWLKNIAPGYIQVPFERDLKLLNLAEGVYPTELSLTLADRQIVVDRSFLVVLDPKDTQMPVALVWNLHQPEHRMPNGVFVNDDMAALVENRPEKQGLLTQQLAALSENPTIKANLAISPILAEQLQAMGGGYILGKGRRRQQVTSNETGALDAKSWLDSLTKATAAGQVETLSSPYGQAPLPVLSALGWRIDSLGQLRAARTAGGKEQNSGGGAPGLYLPGLLIDEPSAKSAVRSGFKYAVADPGRAAGRKRQNRPRRLLEFKSGGRSLTIFPGDTEIADWLRTVAPEKAGPELTALLAQRLIAGGAENPVIIAPNTGSSLLNGELVKQIYQMLSRTPWLKTVNLASSLDRPREDVKLNRLPVTLSADKAYLATLKSARRDLNDFASAVSAKNGLRRRLERLFYVSESIDYLLDSGDGVPALGKAYADSIRQTIDSEFSKLELAPPAKITFSSRTGKIPIAIVNRAGYPVRARLLLSGKEFLFSDDKREKVTLMPKENLVSYNITAGFVGVSKLTASIYVGHRKIASRQIEVRVSNLLRYLIIGATTLLVGGGGMAIFLRGRKEINEI